MNNSLFDNPWYVIPESSLSIWFTKPLPLYIKNKLEGFPNQIAVVKSITTDDFQLDGTDALVGKSKQRVPLAFIRQIVNNRMDVGLAA